MSSMPWIYVCIFLFIYQALIKEKHLYYLTSGPCMCLSLQRENAVKKLLELLGPEDPLSARRQNQFHWRGVFGADAVSNAFYGNVFYPR